MLVPRPNIWGIPEIMFRRIRMFMWSAGGLQLQSSARSVGTGLLFTFPVAGPDLGTVVALGV